MEVHANDTDIFYVTEGDATVVTGGTPVDAKTTGAGEVRAEKITGGVTRRLTKGDVVVISARTIPGRQRETSSAISRSARDWR